jgi:hypothetical protein
MRPKSSRFCALNTLARSAPNPNRKSARALALRRTIRCVVPHLKNLISHVVGASSARSSTLPPMIRTENITNSGQAERLGGNLVNVELQRLREGPAHGVSETPHGPPAMAPKSTIIWLSRAIVSGSPSGRRARPRVVLLSTAAAPFSRPGLVAEAAGPVDRGPAPRARGRWSLIRRSERASVRPLATTIILAHESALRAGGYDRQR